MRPDQILDMHHRVRDAKTTDDLLKIELEIRLADISHRLFVEQDAAKSSERVLGEWEAKPKLEAELVVLPPIQMGTLAALQHEIPRVTHYLISTACLIELLIQCPQHLFKPARHVDSSHPLKGFLLNIPVVVFCDDRLVAAARGLDDDGLFSIWGGVSFVP